MKKLSIMVIISFLAHNFLFSQDQEVIKALKKSDFYRGGSEGVEWNVKVQNIEQGQLKNDLVLSVEGSANDSHFYSLISFMGPKKFEGQKLLIRDNSMWFIKQGLTNPEIGRASCRERVLMPV